MLFICTSLDFLYSNINVHTGWLKNKIEAQETEAFEGGHLGQNLQITPYFVQRSSISSSHIAN